MSGRPVAYRLRVRGLLEVMTPLHVGGLVDDPDVDLPAAIDGASRLYVPGTSLAGVFRNWMSGRGDVEGIDGLWGHAEEASGSASRIVVRDGLVLGPDREPLPPARLEARTSVGIDRHTGAAARTFLFSRAVVPVGSYVAVDLDLESPAAELPSGEPDAEQARMLDRARLGALLRALRAGGLTLGAASTRGLGQVRLVDFAVEEHDLTSPEGLVALLRGQPATVDPAMLTGPARLNPRPTIEITIGWRPRSPVMVRADAAAIGLDSLPLTGADGAGRLRLVIPGSSLKGALRAHAERSMRTLHGERAPVPPSGAGGALDDSAVFRDQLAQDALICAVFGSAPDAAESPAVQGRSLVVPHDPALPMDVLAESAPPVATRGGRGALGIAECRSTTALDEDAWRRLVITETPDAGQHSWLTRSGLAPADHVAIDRWTGGAADKLLFSVLEPWGVDWEPIRLRVDLDRLGAEADPALALLLLVLRDLHAGRLPLGGGVNRGLGDLTTTSITISSAPDDAADPGGGQTLANYLAGATGQRIIAGWRRLWPTERAT